MRLDRYMWRELFVPFLIGTLTVLVLFQANHLIYIFKTFSPTAVPWTATAQLILFESPKWMFYALPMGTSLATSLAVSRITRESELTALRSAGASLTRIMRPVVLFGVVASIASWYMTEHIQPMAGRASKRLMSQVLIRAAVPDFKSNVSMTLANRQAFIGTISRSGNDTVLLNNILLYERPDGRTTILTKAETGKYQDGVWTIDRPTVWTFEGNAMVRVTPRSSAGVMTINERITIETFFLAPDSEELSTPDLKKAIAEMRRLGSDTRRGEITLATRISVPAACFVLALVTPIFAIVFARTGAYIGVLLGVLTTMAYYNLFIISKDVLGPNGILDPLLAAWAPNILFFVIGMLGLRRIE